MLITIYSTKTCATCHIVTEWMDKHGLPYTKKNIDEDASTMLEFMSVNNGHIGVPFTVITKDDGSQTKIPGYNVDLFKHLATA